MSGEAFRAEALSGLESELSGLTEGGVPYPDLLRSIALIRLRQAELAYQSGQTTLGNLAFDQAELAVGDALALAPCDGFLWFSEGWLALTRYQPVDRVKRMLALSYKTSANEGWIAVRRNSISFLIFATLGKDLRRSAIDELQDLMATAIYVPAVAQVLAGPGSRFRDQVLPALQFAPEDNRKRLSYMLTELGVDAVVPGIPSRGDRPWN